MDRHPTGTLWLSQLFVLLITTVMKRVPFRKKKSTTKQTFKPGPWTEADLISLYAVLREEAANQIEPGVFPGDIWQKVGSRIGRKPNTCLRKWMEASRLWFSS